jgi:hypothetical protein
VAIHLRGVRLWIRASSWEPCGKVDEVSTTQRRVCVGATHVTVGIDVGNLDGELQAIRVDGIGTKHSVATRGTADAGRVVHEVVDRPAGAHSVDGDDARCMNVRVVDIPLVAPLLVA